MGAGTVNLTSHAEPSHENADTNEPAVLEREVEDIRENISGIVSELDRRKDELLDWRTQVRKHAVLLVAVGASCILGLTLTLAIGAAQRRRRNRPLEKARRLRAALSRIIANPELVAPPRPSITRKALGAAASASAGILAKSLAQQLVGPVESGD
jgi:predicted protein tyrosine phosphatase